MNNRYFEITIREGKRFYQFSFNKKCNHLEYSDPNYLICQRKEDNKIQILAMFPHSSVVSIVNMEG